MSALLQQVLAAKRQRRLALAALPFPEKVRIVEQLRQTLANTRGGTTRQNPRGDGAHRNSFP